jgi:hypothetical protein
MVETAQRIIVKGEAEIHGGRGSVDKRNTKRLDAIQVHRRT